MIWLARFTETSDCSFLLNDGKTQKIYICQLGMTNVWLAFNQETFLHPNFFNSLCNSFNLDIIWFLHIHVRFLVLFPSEIDFELYSKDFFKFIQIKWMRNWSNIVCIYLVSSDSWVSQRLPFLISKSLKSVYASNPSSQGCMIDLSTEYRFRLLT